MKFSGSLADIRKAIREICQRKIKKSTTGQWKEEKESSQNIAQKQAIYTSSPNLTAPTLQSYLCGNIDARAVALAFGVILFKSESTTQASHPLF